MLKLKKLEEKQITEGIRGDISFAGIFNVPCKFCNIRDKYFWARKQ